MRFGFYLPWVDFFKGLWWSVLPLNNIAFWYPSQNFRVDQEGNVNQLDWPSLCLLQDWPLAHADLEPQLSGLSKWSVLEQAEWFFRPFVPQWILVYWENIVFLSLLYTSRVTVGCSTPSSTWVQVWHSCEIRAGIGLSMAPRCTFPLCYEQSQMTFSCYSYVIVYTLFSKFRMIILTQLNFLYWPKITNKNLIIVNKF